VVLNKVLITLFFFLTLSKSSYALDKSSLSGLQFPTGTEVSYKQIRFIKSTNFKLKSSGVLKIHTNMIEWHQTIPFVHIVIMKDGVMTAGDAKSSQEVTNPMAKKMARIMFDLFQGNLNALEKIFTIQTLSPGIKIKLTPIDQSFAGFIKDIRLFGQTNVDKFYLEESSGNSLTIKFSNFTKIKKLK
jgi:hypothetical protein